MTSGATAAMEIPKKPPRETSTFTTDEETWVRLTELASLEDVSRNWLLEHIVKEGIKDVERTRSEKGLPLHMAPPKLKALLETQHAARSRRKRPPKRKL